MAEPARFYSDVLFDDDDVRGISVRTVASEPVVVRGFSRAGNGSVVVVKVVVGKPDCTSPKCADVVTGEHAAGHIDLATCVRPHRAAAAGGLSEHAITN